jgi:membrane-associated phospholipid phosphatase
MNMTGQLRFAFAAAVLGCSTPAFASTDDWDKASDIGRAGLVVAALGAPVVQGDWEGGKEAVFSIGAAYAVTRGLKWAIHEERPDGSGDDSFPSLHASTSFAAAATLQRRYGWKVGIPAHAVATFVAVARVKADKHFTHDVIIGAAIGEAAGLLLTSPANENVQWLPWGNTKGGGATVAIRF